jgi:hypothetical protein
LSTNQVYFDHLLFFSSFFQQLIETSVLQRKQIFDVVDYEHH